MIKITYRNLLDSGEKYFVENTKSLFELKLKCPHPQPMTHAPAVRRDALPSAMYVAAAASLTRTQSRWLVAQSIKTGLQRAP